MLLHRRGNNQYAPQLTSSAAAHTRLTVEAASTGSSTKANVNSGPDGDIQESLQKVADTVHAIVEANHLACSPNKSELLVIRKRGTKIEHDMNKPIKISWGNPIPSVQIIQVLGMLIQNNTHNAEVIKRLQTTARQIGKLSSMATKLKGMKEADLCRLAQAFLISRCTYSYPYYQLRQTDEEAVNSIIRTA